MNLVTLVNREPVTLASGSLVYSAHETSALQEAIVSADALASRLSSESERIAQAEAAGHKEGHAAGYAEGLALAKAETGAHLAALTAETQLHLQQQRAQTLAMAVQIVKKITANFASDEVLVALARTAARECATDESISLTVHPEQHHAVCRRIESLMHEESAASETGHSEYSAAEITEVLTDDSLPLDGCVLQTRYGSVVADLQTQLDAIESRLGNAHG